MTYDFDLFVIGGGSGAAQRDLPSMIPIVYAFHCAVC